MSSSSTDGKHGLSSQSWRAPATPSRAQLRAVIPRRMKVGLPTAMILAVAFALVMVPVIRFDVWLAQSGALEIVPGETAPVTVRVPPFASGEQAIDGGAIVVARGDVVDARAAAIVADVRAHTPHGLFGDLAYFAVVMSLTFIYTLQLRRSNRGRFLRTQVVLLGSMAAVALVVKLFMLLTPMSVLAVPVALLALTAAMAIDREGGVATGVLASVVVSLLVPFDIGVTAILLVQALTASLLLPDRIRRRWRVALWAGLASAVAGALAYGVVHYLTRGSAPVDELGRATASSWMAATAGGLIAAFATVPAVPGLQFLCGEITDGTLIALEDLSHPMLKQIAEKSPGTWQHSLAMANMAEIAANAIGANGRLVRVGAYFHDLGKSLQPKYFIENVEAGEQSPHDRLPPEVSCDAIFAHVTEGIALARRQKLPERIIDFMHMHHGDGVLEYFWAKCNEQGNPKGLSTEDFRYPGVPPQSRETAILAICDAVEAASRTLRRPDQKAIDSLVQRIVYGKLHLGQLDESGLSMADLRKINDSLRETIKHAHHGRIEYPWQRDEQPAAAAAAPVETQATIAAKPPRASESITQRMMDEPRLDSLDSPRPPWAAGASGSGSGDVRPRRPSGSGKITGPATGADTAPMAAAPDPTVGTAATASLRPRTAMLADSVDVGHAATAQHQAQAGADTTGKHAAPGTVTGVTQVMDDLSSTSTATAMAMAAAAAERAPTRAATRTPSPGVPAVSSSGLPAASSSSPALPTSTPTMVGVAPAPTPTETAPAAPPPSKPAIEIVDTEDTVESAVATPSADARTIEAEPPEAASPEPRPLDADAIPNEFDTAEASGVLIAPTPRWSGTFAAAAEQALVTPDPARVHRAETSPAAPGYREEVAVTEAAAIDDETAAAVPTVAEPAFARSSSPAPATADRLLGAGVTPAEEPPDAGIGDEPPTTVKRRAASLTPWGARIADRIDALLEAAGDEPSGLRAPADPEHESAEILLERADAKHVRAGAGSGPADAVPEDAEPETTVRRAPPPPPGARAKRSTQEVDGEDVEATIEVSPSARDLALSSGRVSGPPPATRAVPPTEPTDEEPTPPVADDDEVTVVPTRPPSSMLPPRQRTQGKPRE